MDYDLICIGCGPAGEKAATQAAYFGRRVAIVERAPHPGGAMVNTGTLPSKALRETALLFSAFRRRPVPGMESDGHRPESVARFMARRHLVEHEEHDRIEASLDRHGIDIVRGTGALVDAHTVRVTGADGAATDLTARCILVATGSSPVRPGFVPFDRPHVVDADGVLALERLPASMIVVGAGVIGCEYACVFNEIGVDVTIVHPKGDVLPFIDAECRDHLLRAMADNGVTFRTGAAVEAIDAPADDRVAVALDDGGTVEAEALLWAAGRSSNTDGLGLEDVGVAMGSRGLVLVDEDYRTNVPSIYAAGDVIGFPALASTSMEQGRIAACRMFDLGFKSDLDALMPYGLYTIPAISEVGMSDAKARETGRAVVVGRATYRGNARGRMLGDDQGMAKCVFDARTRALLGATIVGEDATELIHLAQCAIAHGGTIESFISTCFNYPSLSELYKYCAYDALGAMAAREAA